MTSQHTEGKKPLVIEQKARTSKAREIRLPANSPLSEDILAVEASKVKLPGNFTYDGSTDPQDHLDSFKTKMHLKV